MITDEVELLRSMVAIPSVSGEERALSAFLADRMRAAGFDAHVDAVGNVHGVVGGDGPEIVLLGHIDTVPGDLPVRVDGDVLHGRGSVDAKGPFATFVCAAARVAKTIAARVRVIGAVDEERTSVGARHLLSRTPPNALVIGEPSGVHRVGIGYKGVFRFRVEVVRPSAHTSSAAATAAEEVVRLWQAVRDRLARRYPGELPLFEQALPSVVDLRGDLENASLEVSCRVPVGFDPDAFTAELHELAAAVGAHGVHVIESVPAVRSSRTDPVVRALTAAIRAIGGNPVPTLKLGTADWNVVGPSWQCPVAAYGPGDSRLCHTPEEHIRLPEYLAAIEVLADALPRLAASVRPQLATAGGGSSRSGGSTS